MQVYKHKRLLYDVKPCEPGDPDYECRIKRKDGKLLTDYPPAFILTGRSASKYGLFPAGTSKSGDPTVFKAYNLRADQNYWATPFGQSGFTVDSKGLIQHTHSLRAKPRQRRKRFHTPAGMLLPLRSSS